MNETKYDLASLLVVVVGFWQGIAPLIALATDWDPWLAAPLRLDTPWSAIVAVLAIVATVAVLAAIDTAKKRNSGNQ